MAGGFHGAAPRLDRIGEGNPPYAIDFRQVYATVLDGWWGADSRSVLGGSFEAVPFLRAAG